MFDEAYVNLLFLITVSHALHIIKARITVGTYHWKIALCKIYYKEKKKERVLALTEYSKQIKSSCKSICRFSISSTCDPCHHRNKHQNAKSFPHKFYTTNIFFFFVMRISEWHILILPWPNDLRYNGKLVITFQSNWLLSSCIK